jgi:transcriptional regulator with XRE-family HTH domain
MAIPPDFARQIREARLAQDMTQATLAQRVGITQAMVSQIENGIAGSSGKLLAICRVLSLDPPQFLAYDDEAAWLEIGRALRRKNPASFEAVLKLAQSLTPPAEDDTGSDGNS